MPDISSRWRWLALLVLVLPLVTLASAAAPTLAPVAVLNTQPSSTSPLADDFTVVSPQRLLFSSRTPHQGRELWFSDGTPAGTTFLDLAPGPVGSNPRWLRVIDGTAWFWASPAADVPPQLWRSDGTLGGTLPFSAAYAQVDAITPDELAQFGQRMGFSGVTASAGAELWLSDGTPGGTVQVSDINPGPAGSAPALLTPAGAWLYFTAFDGSAWGIWRTDGTATALVLPNIHAQELAVVAGSVYVAGQNPDQLCGLWRIDPGATPTTTLIDDVCAHDLTEVAGHLVYWIEAQPGVDPTATVWTTAPAAAPALLGEFPPLSQSLHLLRGNATFGTNTLFVVPNWGNPLWIKFGASVTVETLISPIFEVYEAALLDDALVYAGYAPANHGQQTMLASFDGQSVQSYPAYTSKLTAWNNRLVFTDRPDQEPQIQTGGSGALWLDVTELAGTEFLHGHPLQQPLPSQMNGPLDLELSVRLDSGTLLAPSGSNYYNLGDLVSLRPDGSDATVLCADCVYGATSLGAWALMATPTGYQATDGATVIDLPVPPGVINNYVVSGTMAYLLPRDAAGNIPLWRTDGTAAGTQSLGVTVAAGGGWILGDAVFAAYAGNTIQLVDLANPSIVEVHLPADEHVVMVRSWLANTLLIVSRGPDGITLWRMEPTGANLTPLIADVPVLRMIGPLGAQVAVLVNGEAIWTVGVSGPATQLAQLGAVANGAWEFLEDGAAYYVYSAAGVLRLTELAATPLYMGTVDTSYATGGLHQVPGGIYFTSLLNPQPANTQELWFSDGTPAGTVQLFASTTARPAQILYAAADEVYFRTHTLTAGPNLPQRAPLQQLWHSTTTPGSPVVVAQGRSVEVLGGWADHVALGLDYGAGLALWRSDGTVAGTQPLGHLIVSAGWSQFGERLYLSGDDGIYGLEPWVTDGTAAGTHMLADINRGALSAFNWLTVEGASWWTNQLPNWQEYNGRVWFNAFDGLHGEQVFSVPLTAALTLRVPPSVATSGAVAQVPVALAPSASIEPAAGPFTLTLTLPAGVSYASDTSGVTPAASGADLTWTFAQAPEDFAVTLDLPAAAQPPAEYALQWSLSSAAGTTSAATVVKVRWLLFAPLIAR